MPTVSYNNITTKMYQIITNLQKGFSAINNKYLIKVFEAEELDKVYYLLAFVRVLLTVIPQKGYIHPDEFFQSTEIMAGDVFGTESNRPWEFNQSFPIRSIFVPYLVVGVPYKCLRSVDTQLQYYLGVTLKTPYWLTVLPRIHYCMLSFIVDYCLYKICTMHYEKYKGKLIILASSYVMQVYGSHTFSNTIEMVLMAILLYLVVESHSYSYTIAKQNEFLKKKYDQSTVAADRARLYKIFNALPSHSLRHCVFISFVVTMGVFNRPTFILFAFPGVFFWIYRGIGYKIVTLSEIHTRMFLFALTTLIFSAFFILVDSVYFGYLSLAELLQVDISMHNFVITPLNFIKYNINTDKLAEHGLHPRFLHLLVNMPLLYNVLSAIAIIKVIIFIIKLVSGRHRSLPSIHNIRCLMTGAIFFPIATLSYFPHQEARFLIPVTLPLVYLHADELVRSKNLRRCWWLLNSICLLFFGFVHQAGVLSLASHLSVELQPTRQVHLVTSHVYSLPVGLLTQRNSQQLYGSGASRYLLPKTLVLHELGSQPATVVLHTLAAIQRAKLHNSNRIIRSADVLLALPFTKWPELHQVATSHSLRIELDAAFYPHISTEAMPYLHLLYSNSSYYLFTSAYHFMQSCGLGLFKVYYNDTVTFINKNAFI